MEEFKEINIFENEYHIPVEETMRKDVDIMCNLSQGVKEEAILETINNVISSMHEKGYTVMEIADVLKMSSEEVIERLK